jgi:lipid II:glycine glycyltransferase (peptidoglycan interpeptide bridge formation enzyme)
MLENKNYTEWDHKVAKDTGWCHFLQSAEWAKVQASHNWKSELTELGLTNSSFPVALYRRRAPGLGTVYQIPKLAYLQSDKVVEFTEVMHRKLAGAVALKIDVDQPFDDSLHRKLLKQGWKRVPSIQYRETVVIDLTKDREELLKSFKKRARTEVNAGLRRGVEVEKLPVNQKNMDLVYNLLEETYRRAGFVTRKRRFTEDYWREFAEADHGSIYIASHENRPLAAAYIIHIGDRAFYKDGASIRVKPDVFASRVMQWQIMQGLKEQGIKTYDLCGVSSRGGSEIAGVSLFKTGFGEPIQLQWGYELPLSRWRYKFWKGLLERIITRYSLSVKKELWY